MAACPLASRGGFQWWLRARRVRLGKVKVPTQALRLFAWSPSMEARQPSREHFAEVSRVGLSRADLCQLRASPLSTLWHWGLSLIDGRPCSELIVGVGRSSCPCLDC